MPAERARRPPEAADLLRVLAELDKQRVEYALLGGAAMAFHGFPRMTQDIDLILPRSSRNNIRLLAALEALRDAVRLDHLPTKKALDAGFCAAADGELGIDLLFMAGPQPFEGYRKHIVERSVGGVRVKLLDLDGMLISKQTDRHEDIADRQRLMRLKGVPGP